jgi:hypothetical protein
MDLTVPEVMERGFYPDMPWSLRATASVMLPLPGRLLTEDVFQGLPFSQLAGILSARLEDGLARLRQISREDIIARGQIHGQAA